jgi:cobalamin-dependent methionine synthase I
MVANDLNLYVNDFYGNKSIYRRLSPGYGDWPIADQEKIFAVLDPDKNIGVKLTDSHIMIPEKSTSGIMGIISK